MATSARMIAPGWSEERALAYLERDGGRVPCSRYGWDSESCAPWAIAAAMILLAERDGDVRDTLDHCMSLVVNDHDDVAELVAAYGAEHDVDPDLVEEAREMVAPAPEYRLLVLEDPDPDLSWLPSREEYEADPVLIDGRALTFEEYGDPAVHVSWLLVLEESRDEGETWEAVASVGGVQFLADHLDGPGGPGRARPGEVIDGEDAIRALDGYVGELARELLSEVTE